MLWYAAAAGVVVAAVLGMYLTMLQPEVIDSIAVLPFENLSGQTDQEYFYDGMTIAIIDEFMKIGSLRTVSWQSVKRFRKTDKSISEIAGLLGVKAIVSAQVL